MDMSSGIAAFESKHFTAATRLLAPRAELGNPEAQYRMAIMAQNGLGMVENPSMALRYMQAAAESGMGLAQHGLGFMYMQGECVEQDGQKALEWFTRAAEQGLQGAMTTIGMMYREGDVLERDEEKAREWFRKAGFDDFELPLEGASVACAAGAPPRSAAGSRRLRTASASISSRGSLSSHARQASVMLCP